MALLAAIVCLIAGCSDSSSEPTSEAPIATNATTTTMPPPPEIRVAGWTAVDPPKNAGKANVHWFRGANGQYVAVATPAKSPPWPMVIYYHGGSGLFPIETNWLPQLARAGYAVVTGCWNAGSTDGVSCPGVTNPGEGVVGINQFAKKLPGADLERVAVMGVSSGGAPAALTPDKNVKALIADSGFAPGLRDVVAPILVLTGGKDPGNAAEQAWARQLRDAGETVETKHYENGEHVVTLAPDTTKDATAVVIDFLNRRLS
jgi:acetyl esterase/lipase